MCVLRGERRSGRSRLMGQHAGRRAKGMPPNLAEGERPQFFYFYRVFGGTRSRREITAIASYDAVCIGLLACANKMSPMAIPTKNTTTNATLIMPPFRGGPGLNSPQLLVQKFLVTLIHLAPSGRARTKRGGTGRCSEFCFDAARFINSAKRRRT